MLFSSVFYSERFLSLVVSNRYDWMFWSCESLTCLLLSLRAVFSTMLEFLLLCDFAWAVAPDSFQEPLRLVLLVVNSIFIGFSFVSGVLPASPKF